MFKAFDDPKGNFSFFPLPSLFFLDPSPFGNGALLVLKKFALNSTALSAAHGAGIKQAAGQVISTFGKDQGSLEVYGLTDRSGSETINMTVSAARANTVLRAVKAALGLSDFHMTSSMGLGERFADEYQENRDNTKNENMRGVACYFWESISTARDPMLVTSIKFAKPPNGGPLLGPLFLGRFRSTPPSPFA